MSVAQHMLNMHVIATKPSAMLLTSRDIVSIYAEDKNEEPRNGKQSVAALSILIRQCPSNLTRERKYCFCILAQLVLPFLGLCSWCNKT